MPCGNIECHTKVDKHDEALFGEDGLGGLNELVKDKVSKKSVRWLASLIAIPALGGILYLYSGVTGASNIYATQKEVAEISEKVAVNAEQFKHIKESLTTIKEQVGTTLSNQTEITKDLKAEIRELRKMHTRSNP